MSSEHPSENPTLYVVECRLLPSNVEQIRMTPPVPERALFGYSFSDEKSLGREETITIAMGALKEISPNFPQLHFELDRIDVRDGSVEILLLVKSLALDQTGTSAGALLAGSLLLWAGDKFFGGAVGEWGKQVTMAIWAKVRGGEPRHSSELCDPRAIADEVAKKVAEERGGRAAIASGPWTVNGTFHYNYELINCGRRYVNVIVDKGCKGVPIITVHD
jgi:hypothetical protein